MTATTEVKVGRELDALVAEKVMGMNVEYITTHENHAFGKDDHGWFCLDCDYDIVPEYSTDIAAAWEVVEKLRNKFQWELHVSDIWVAVVWDQIEPYYVVAHCYGGTMPEAICRAALKAVGA